MWQGDWSAPDRLPPLQRFSLANSDVVSFHNYGNLGSLLATVRNLRQYGRPLLCTEYMSRPFGSTFDPLLENLKRERVGAYNWGFVAGKTQTNYPWDSWDKTYAAEPPVWFHDI
ncbi:MAG: 1,4-beta-xylanase, partial [Planctomycetia bacterium]|nr:1,4-beta-xylanase [Planctomycetia bacterium]